MENYITRNKLRKNKKYESQIRKNMRKNLAYFKGKSFRKSSKQSSKLPSAVFGGDVNSGMPLFFLVKVEVLRSNKFSCDDVTELCLDRGRKLNPVLTLELELMFKLLLELELDISPA